jgi:hypothetical protein
MNTRTTQERIKEIEATERALIGTDEGTHGKPGYHRIYEEISGERYATYSFAGSNATRCSVESAYADTDGRIRQFCGEIERMAALRTELRSLRAGR